MPGTRISLKSLSLLCRSLSTMLQSGVMIHKAVATSSRRIGGPKCQRILEEVAARLEAGDDLSTALERHGRYFPLLFVDMVHVAEHSGALPEVLVGLADHYENIIRLRRNFLASIAWPAIQLTAAIFIITLVIWLLGVIGESRGGEPIDVLGWGLTGASGAATFFFGAWGTILGIVGLWFLLTEVLGQQRVLHSLLLQVPVIGHCLRSFAIARFSWAFYLTQQTGMPITRSIEASLRATSNGAFIAATPLICGYLEEGEDLATALEASRLFPEDYLQMVHVGETSGTVPEMLHRMSPQFEEQARRSLSALATAVGWLVWLIVAGFIIFVIFSIVAWYLGMLNQAIQGI